jgi:hypothetical protein
MAIKVDRPDYQYYATEDNGACAIGLYVLVSTKSSLQHKHNIYNQMHGDGFLADRQHIF